MRFLAVPALLGAVLLAGCVREAHIAMPADVAAGTERIELTGMGGWQSGHFKLGSSEGRFTRRASQTRAGIGGAFVRNIGGGGFDVRGPEFGGGLAGTCGFHQTEVDAGIVVIPGARLAYGCEFDRDGLHLSGGLLLKEVPTSRSVLAGRTRAGEIQLGDLKLDIRPIHHMQGGGLPTGSPLGYAFDLEGRQIGAIDLNGPNKTVYAPRAAGPERDAVLTAAIALSIFWDPGDND
jgi:hypothetical protein